MDKTKNFYTDAEGNHWRLSDPGHFQDFLEKEGEGLTIPNAVSNYVARYNKATEVDEDGMAI